MHVDAGQCAGPQLGHEVAIDLHGMNDRAGPRDRDGQLAAAGADFEEDVTRLRGDGGDDLVDPRALEEVLPESLARLSCPPKPWRRRNH